jgi:hypothetical protein
VLDNAMICCFFKLHVTSPSPTWNEYPKWQNRVPRIKLSYPVSIPVRLDYGLPSASPSELVIFRSQRVQG